MAALEAQGRKIGVRAAILLSVPTRPPIPKMSLELYLGPMFAGKSSAVLGLIRRNVIIGRKTLCLTNKLDTRYSTEAKIVSHNQESHPATAVAELLPLLRTQTFQDADCVIIEEAQFFPDLRAFVLEAVESFGKDVLCVGLDGDSERQPFGQLLDLIPYADSIQKFKALCRTCANGTEAIFTFRRPGAPTTQVNVGGTDTYEPMCRRHYLEAKHDARIQTFIRLKSLNPELPPLKTLEECIREFGLEEGNEIFQRILAETGLMPSTR
jgi:thymidine kinase